LSQLKSQLVENERVPLIAPTGDSICGARRLTGVAYLGFVFTGIVNTFLGPILPLLAARWTLSDSRAGYFFVTQFLGSILGVGISTLLLPLRGFRYCLGLAYLLMAAGVSGLALVQWKYALLGAFILGIGFGLAIPVTNVLISNANQDRRASALSILNFCWGVGAVFAPIALADSARRNQAYAFVLCLSGFLLLVAIALTFTSGPPTQESEPSGRPSTPVEWRLAAIVGGMFFLYVAIETSIGGWIATLVQRVPFSGAHNWSLAPSLFWTGLLAGRGFAPLTLKFVNERRLAITGLTVAGLAMCILVASSRWQWIIVAGFIIGFGLAAVFPITIAQLSRFRSAEKRSAGPMFALAGLGGATMPWLVGAVSTCYGSLQAGLMVPLLGTGVLLWLHAIENTGSQEVTPSVDPAEALRSE
jgi:FHS family glucose/mannose:H+ symporter-like MFS transporter